MAGINSVEGDFSITMDDDLQHPPSYIIDIINKLSEGFDVYCQNIKIMIFF